MLLGFADGLEEDALKGPYNAKTDALLLRYIVAAMTNEVITTHLSKNFEGKGRAAWQFLNESYGLKTLSQSVLRRGIEELKITVSDDPRVAIMQMERYAERLDPKMTPKEMSEQPNQNKKN